MDFKSKKSKRYLLWTFFVVLIISIFTIAVVGDEIVTGYAINKNLGNIGEDPGAILSGIESLQSDIDSSETNLESCRILNEDYLQQVLEYKNQAFVCEEEKKEVESDLAWAEEEYQLSLTSLQEECDEKKSQAEIDLAQLEIDYEDLEEETDRIIQNSANNKCCKEKVDNSDINSYTISNDRIICMEDASNEINC